VEEEEEKKRNRNSRKRQVRSSTRLGEEGNENCGEKKKCNVTRSWRKRS
jgi:hypothetical protein